MQKILCLLLIFCAVLLVSCGGEKGNADITTEIQGGENEAATKPLSEYVVAINNEDYRADALNFVKKLKSATGVSLDVVDELDEGAAVINYGTLSAEKRRFKAPLCKGSCHRR